MFKSVTSCVAILSTFLLLDVKCCDAQKRSSQLLEDKTSALFETKIRPLLVQYCADCHAPGEMKNLDFLAAKTHADFARFRDLYAGVFEALGTGSMPPKNSNQLSSAEKRLVLDWIKKRLNLDQNYFDRIAQYVVSIYEDQKGNLWFGTMNKGVACFDGQTLKWFSEKDGLPSSAVPSFAEGKDGNLWVGTQDGVCIFNGTTFRRIGVDKGLPARSTPSSMASASVKADREGNIWASVGQTIYQFNGKVFIPFDLPINKEGISSYSIVAGRATLSLEDKKGNLWFATDGYGALRYDGKSFTRFTKKDGLCSNNVTSILEDKNGNIWFTCIQSYQPHMTGDGGVCRYDGKAFTKFPNVKGLSENDIYTIYETEAGNIWIGASGVGAYRYSEDTFTLFCETNRKHWTRNFGLQDMLEDRNGVLWFGFSGGLFRFDGKSFFNITTDGPWPARQPPRLLPDVKLEGHTDQVNHATFSPDGNLIGTASRDGTARLWNIEGKQLAALEGPSDSILFSADGTRILTRAPQELRLWDKAGKLLAVIPIQTDGVVFSPKGNRFVTRSKDGTARLFDAEGAEITMLKGHTDWVVHVAYSQSGSQFVTTSDDKTARLWDDDGKLLAILTGHTDSVFYASFSPDGSRITTDSFDKTVRLWDGSGKAIAVLPGTKRWDRGARFRPDGSHFVTASNDQAARLWDNNGQAVAVLAGHDGDVPEARFGPNGNRILTASTDGTARLWDSNGKALAVLDGHADLPIVEFSPDGKHIVTSSKGIARLWNSDGKILSVFGNDNSRINVEFSSDSSRILSRSGGKVARVYQVPQQPDPKLGSPAPRNLPAFLNHLPPDLIVVEGDPIETTTIDELMREHHVPGASIAVIRNGKIEWAHGLGLADVETGRSVTAHTVFQAASINKPITAAAALSMVQDGLLNLDEDINLKLKSWKLPTNEFTEKQPVTLRHLLSHTAGINVLGLPGYERSVNLPSTIDILEGRGNTDSVRATFEPGTNWRYSDGGYVIIGRLMEDVAGKPYSEIIRERVFDRAGMTHSSYIKPLKQGDDELLATGYTISGLKHQGGYRNYPEIGAAGLWTTAEDLARFILAIQHSHAGKPNSMLSKRITELMLTPVKNNYGLGMYLSKDGKRFGHGGTNRGFRIRGSNKGFRTRFSASIEDGWSIVVMTNGDNGSALCEVVPMAAAKAYSWSDDLLLDAYGTYGTIRRKRVDIGQAALERLAGTYKCLPEWSHAVSRQALFPNMAPVELKAVNGRLIAHVRKGSGLERFEFLPQSEFQTMQRRNGLLLDFIVKDGQVTGFKFRDVEAKRISN